MLHQQNITLTVEIERILHRTEMRTKSCICDTKLKERIARSDPRKQLGMSKQHSEVTDSQTPSGKN